MLSPRESANRLQRVQSLCLALPEVASEQHGAHVTFFVRDRKFAYYLNDHHGDGRVALSVRLPRGENATLVDADPGRFYLPAYTAHHGWVALRLDLPDVDWDEVAELLTNSYALQAPRRLAAQLPVPAAHPRGV